MTTVDLEPGAATKVKIGYAEDVLIIGGVKMIGVDQAARRAIRDFLIVREGFPKKDFVETVLHRSDVDLEAFRDLLDEVIEATD